MIVFKSNLLNNVQFSNPVTIVHEYSESTQLGFCSVHELQFIENYLESPLVFKTFPCKNQIFYATPNEFQENRLKTLTTSLVRRIIEKPKKKTQSLIFKKVD